MPRKAETRTKSARAIEHGHEVISKLPRDPVTGRLMRRTAAPGDPPPPALAPPVRQDPPAPPGRRWRPVAVPFSWAGAPRPVAAAIEVDTDRLPELPAGAELPPEPARRQGDGPSSPSSRPSLSRGARSWPNGPSRSCAPGSGS